MVHDIWCQNNEDWYYLGSYGVMVKGQQTSDGKWYIIDEDGKMITDSVILMSDQNDILQYPELAK